MYVYRVVPDSICTRMFKEKRSRSRDDGIDDRLIMEVHTFI